MDTVVTKETILSLCEMELRTCVVYWLRSLKGFQVINRLCVVEIITVID
jgi:hypothetical protein